MTESNWAIHRASPSESPLTAQSRFPSFSWKISRNSDAGPSKGRSPEAAASSAAGDSSVVSDSTRIRNGPVTRYLRCQRHTPHPLDDTTSPTVKRQLDRRQGPAGSQPRRTRPHSRTRARAAWRRRPGAPRQSKILPDEGRPSRPAAQRRQCHEKKADDQRLRFREQPAAAKMAPVLKRHALVVTGHRPAAIGRSALGRLGSGGGGLDPARCLFNSCTRSA